MSSTERFVARVNSALESFLEERGEAMLAIAPDLRVLRTEAKASSAGGKRMRAAFIYWGWRAVAGADPEADHTVGTEHDPNYTHVVQLACAVELFHAAALVHDDLIDDSDTRRGRPSSHRAFEALHREREWAGEAEPWSRGAAILLGDLLLNWADDLVGRVARKVPAGDAVWETYRRMREEVTLGQFLDLLEEAAWIRQEPAALLQRAQTVAIHKSAKYSVQEPLLLGAALAGASEAQRASLEGYGLPIGLAFQMRDDLLGVFGDPSVTGKPAGDDLREGKRTVLIELARQSLPGNVRNTLDELLGDRNLESRQIELLQNAIRSSGAPESIERMIEAAVGTALEALHEGEFSRGAELELERLAVSATRREA